MKFNIGDRVRVIDSVFDLFTTGMTGTITAVTGDYLGPCYDVQQEGWEGYIGSWPMYEEELELIP